MIGQILHYFMFVSDGFDFRRRWMVYPFAVAVLTTATGAAGLAGWIPVDLAAARDSLGGVALQLLYWEVAVLLGLALWGVLVMLSLWHRLVDSSAGKPGA